MIDVPTCTGSVIDHGANVMDWQPRGHGPVLFASSKAVYAEDTALRGGIPICFPWFGPGREPGSPYGHGFARTAAWNLVGNDITEEAQTVSYRLSHDDASDGYWPHQFWAVLTASFGVELTVSLSVTNLDTQAFSYEAALHTYLSVGSIRDVRIEGLDGAELIDKTAGGTVRTQVGPLTFTAETDNVYASRGPSHRRRLRRWPGHRGRHLRCLPPHRVEPVGGEGRWPARPRRGGVGTIRMRRGRPGLRRRRAPRAG